MNYTFTNFSFPRVFYNVISIEFNPFAKLKFIKVLKRKIME